MAKTLSCFSVIICALLLLADPVAASLVVLPESVFAGTPLIDFTGAPLVPVNGTTISGVLFAFTSNGVPSIDARVANIEPLAADFPNLEGSSGGVLSLTFPVPESIFAYRWAIDSLPSIGPVTNVNRVELFDASH